MRVWKRNLIVVAIVVFVGAAVYLNWSYNQQQVSTQEDVAESKEPGKLLGQSALVNGTSEEENRTSQGSGYFATARLNRQRARDSALELLRKAAADEGADAEAVAQANEAIQTMAAYTMSEAQMENLVTAKGYGDCVCFLNDDSISVVVSTVENGLSDTDIAKIVEIVMEETGLTADRIKIIEADP
jgi:stage III sporulation protein AH